MPDASHFRSLVLVTGLAGAGKSTAIRTFADNGFYIIDNLPVALLGSFFELARDNNSKYARTALLLDVGQNNGPDSGSLIYSLKALREKCVGFQLLFLDASTEEIIKRYSETRRPHPFFDSQQDKSLSDTINRQREQLYPIKELADYVLDTSRLTVHDLRRELEQYAKSLAVVGATEGIRAVRLNFVSFGFKYGIPLDSDLLVDVRFLPNPHFVENLKDKTGLDKEVEKYLTSSSVTEEFLKRYVQLVGFLLPHYTHEGKTYINIAIGCTGGRHRSVYIAEALLQRLPVGKMLVSVKHRDINKASVIC